MSAGIWSHQSHNKQQPCVSPRDFSKGKREGGLGFSVGELFTSEISEESFLKWKYMQSNSTLTFACMDTQTVKWDLSLIRTRFFTLSVKLTTVQLTYLFIFFTMHASIQSKTAKSTSWHALTIPESLLNWLQSTNTCITLAKAAKSAAANLLGTAGPENRMRWKRARNSNCESFHLFSCHEVITRRAKRGRKERKISQKHRDQKKLNLWQKPLDKRICSYKKETRKQIFPLL